MVISERRPGRLAVLLLWVAAATAKENPVLIYNRVRKAGSTYMEWVLGSLARRNTFAMVHDNNYNNKTSMLEQIAALPPGGVYSSHQHYVADVGRAAVWINVVREPIARDNSLYYYNVDVEHEEERAVEEMHRREAAGICGCAGMEYVDCVMLRNASGCYERKRRRRPQKSSSKNGEDDNLEEDDVPSGQSAPTKFPQEAQAMDNPANEYEFVVASQQLYFCEEGEACNLTVAADRLHNAYQFVGITEELEVTLALFERALPRWFAGASTAHATSNPAARRPTNVHNALNPTTHLNGAVSNEALTVLKNQVANYKEEVAFYNKAKHAFWLNAVRHGAIPELKSQHS